MTPSHIYTAGIRRCWPLLITPYTSLARNAQSPYRSVTLGMTVWIHFPITRMTVSGHFRCSCRAVGAAVSPHFRMHFFCTAKSAGVTLSDHWPCTESAVLQSPTGPRAMTGVGSRCRMWAMQTPFWGTTNARSRKRCGGRGCEPATKIVKTGSEARNVAGSAKNVAGSHG